MRPLGHEVWVLVAILVLLGLAAHGSVSAQDVQSVPSAVAQVLIQAQQAPTPRRAIALIDAWSGEPHPLLLLARGQARVQLAQEAVASERAGVLQAASADLQHALALEPGLRQAHLALAQCAALREDWTLAADEEAAGSDPGNPDAAQLRFEATCALHAGDWRLATMAVQAGILRFPEDPGLRRLEVAVLMHGTRGEDARQALLGLLAQKPCEVELWQDLAWAEQSSGHAEEALAALEAALILSPGDASVRRTLVSSQLTAGLPAAAYATSIPLMTPPPGMPAVSDAEVVLLASRAAAEGGALEQARAWLRAVPSAQRTRALELASARYAIQAGDTTAAREALEVLVASGEQDPAVLTWAGVEAERAGASDRAEALYRRAIASDATTSAAAVRLVALYLSQDRTSEAQQALSTYLVLHPDDAQALALQARLHTESPTRASQVP